MTGFEPATSWSQTTRSTKLSYTPRWRMHITHARVSHQKISARDLSPRRPSRGGLSDNSNQCGVSTCALLPRIQILAITSRQVARKLSKMAHRVRDLLVPSEPISDTSSSPLEGEGRVRDPLIVNRTRLRIVRWFPGNNDLRPAHSYRNVCSLDSAAAR